MKKGLLMIRAMAWRDLHEERAEALMKEATTIHKPSNEDYPHPELWKGGSWRWLDQEIRKGWGKKLHE